MVETLTIDERPPTLEEAQKFVGGYVELHTLPDGSQLLVNEEGRLQDLSFNEYASLLAGKLLVGPAILLKGTARWT